MNPVERQFAFLEAVRTSPQAADYFLKNQIEYKGPLFAFEKARNAAKSRNETEELE